jgi:hypothetical protein
MLDKLVINKWLVLMKVCNFLTLLVRKVCNYESNKLLVLCLKDFLTLFNLSLILIRRDY